MFSDGFSLQNWEREKMIEMVRDNQIESIKVQRELLELRDVKQ